jgi:hypothetical protein
MRVKAILLVTILLMATATAITTTAAGPMIPFTVYGYTGYNGMVVRVYNMNTSKTKTVITQQSPGGKGFYQVNLGDMMTQWNRGNKIVVIGFGHYYYKVAYIPRRGYLMKMQ